MSQYGSESWLTSVPCEKKTGHNIVVKLLPTSSEVKKGGWIRKHKKGGKNKVLNSFRSTNFQLTKGKKIIKPHKKQMLWVLSVLSASQLWIHTRSPDNYGVIFPMFPKNKSKKNYVPIRQSNFLLKNSFPMCIQRDWYHDLSKWRSACNKPPIFLFTVLLVLCTTWRQNGHLMALEVPAFWY